MEITLDRLLEILKKNIIFIIIIALLFGALSFIITKYFVPSTYEAKVRMYVDTPASASATQIDQLRKVTQTYIYFLDTVDFCKQILDHSDSSTLDLYTAEDLKSMISYSIINNTEVFDITIRGKDPNVLLSIADVVIVLVPERIKGFDLESNVGVIEKAIPANVNQPVSPDVSNYTVIGIMLGVLISFTLVLIKETFDVRIKSADDITSRFSYPIIGKIPTFYTDLKPRKSGAKYGK